MENIVLGRLEGVEKFETSKFAEVLAEHRIYPNEESVDLSKFVKDRAENNYIEDFSWLVEFIKLGDSKAFNKIDDLLRPLLKGIANKKIIDRGFNTSLINDLVQNTLLKVYESIKIGSYDNFGENDIIRSSVRIIMNNIEDIYRPRDKNSHFVKTRLFKVNESGDFEVNSLSNKGDVETITISEPTISNEYELNLVGGNSKISRALNQISDSHKEIIALRFVENLNHDVIAEVLDISVQNSQSRLNRAVKNLRTKLKETA